MPFVRQNGTLIFTSSRDVVIHYATLIDRLTPQLWSFTQKEDQAVRAEIAHLRQQLADQLKNFGHGQVGEYFREAMTNSESDQECYTLSNAYEAILLAELRYIKDELYALRTTGVGP